MKLSLVLRLQHYLIILGSSIYLGSALEESDSAFQVGGQDARRLASQPSPLVLIPGTAGSALEVNYDLPKVPSSQRKWLCSKSSRGKWERLWIPRPIEFLPKTVDCWSDKIRLYYSILANGTSVVQNAPGVQLRAVSGRKGLDLIPFVPSSNVYRSILDDLDQPVYAAPYDFRLSPTGNPDFLRDLQALVETAYRENGNRTVTLVTHSLGALWGHYFLSTYVSESWKTKFLNAWVPISPAYGGAIYGLRQLISGDNTGVEWLSAQSLKDQQRSFETNVWLLPDPVLYSNTTPLVTLELHRQEQNLSVVYTAQDYSELFSLAGFGNFSLQWDRVRDLTPWDEWGRLRNPGNVTTYPIYGTGVETTIQFQYHESFDSTPTQLQSLEGDGTVSQTSLQAGDHFSETPLVRNGLSHTGILSDPDVLEHIRRITTQEGPINTEH